MPTQHSSHLTLSQLTAAIGAAVTSALPHEQWVVAEVSECKVANAGHCYLVLVERDEGSRVAKAEIRAAIWAQRYKMIASYFRQQTGGDLMAGIKVLVKCSVSYHPLYGLSLVISDIDPTYTVGESERQRQLAIEQLKADGVFQMQQDHQLPQVIQRLAVISSASAAGYEDFCKQIEASPYRFEIELFAAPMQGEQTERGVIAALEKIAKKMELYDAVVIIRGGGSASDLRWFDSYELASNVAQFPLPILTGIGHEKDTSVVDMVAHYMFKTPTAVAAGLIERVERIDSHLLKLQEQVIALGQQKIIGEQQRVGNAAKTLQATTLRSLSDAATKLERLKTTIPSTAATTIERNANRLEVLKNNVPNFAKSIIDRQMANLALMSEKVASNNPRRILALGYSIALNDEGRAIKSLKDTKIGGSIRVEFSDGSVVAQVTNTIETKK